MTPLLILASLVALVAGSRFVPTPEELSASFKQAQKFYASQDYDQAIALYELINRTESPLLYAEEITVEIGELSAPIKEISLYQTGNCYFKQAQEAKALAARTRDPQRQAAHAERAAADFRKAVELFLEAEAKATSVRLRALARNRRVSCLYESGAPGRVIEEGGIFQREYPDSEFLVSVLYNMAWAYFDTAQYEQSIATFQQLVEHFPGDYRADRALFQIGEAHFLRAQYAEAARWYQQVVDRQAIEQLSERELIKMRREKIAGLVDETALELAAKAQLKIGDAHAALGEFDQATSAYRLVIKLFAQERKFVGEAYLRLADRYLERGDFAACIDVHREAIDHVADRPFQARMQYLLAERYYQASRFEEAIEQYRIYEKGYGEVAERAGVPLEQAAYKIARSFYGIGERGGEGAPAAFRQAAVLFAETQERYPDSQLKIALAFNLALAHQMLDEEETRHRALEEFAAIHRAYPDDVYAGRALLQIARLHHRERNYPQAAGTYRQIASTSADSFQADIARLELGITLRDAGDKAGAVEAFLSVRPQGELAAKALLEAGVLLVERGALEQALEVLDSGRAAFAVPEDRAKVFYLRAKAFSGMERYAEAVADFTAAWEASADERFREGTLFGRAVAHANAEAYERAAEDLQRLMESPNEAMKKAALRTLAEVRVHQGREQEAIEHYEALVAASADSAEAIDTLLLLAELYDAAGASGRVIEIAGQVLASTVADRQVQGQYLLKERAYYLLGTAQARQEDSPEALRAYTEGLERYPGGFYAADMRFGSGVALWQLGEAAEAAAAFKQFLAEYPQSPHAVYAHHYLGYIYFNQGMFAEALEHLDKVGDLFPGSEVAPEALFLAGESLFNLQQFEQALSRYRRVFGAYPQAEVADDALYSAAWTMVELEKIPEGMGYFQQLLESHPQSELIPSARLSLGDYYFNQGEYAKAREEYLSVQRETPGHELAQKVPELIAEVLEVEAYVEFTREFQAFRPALTSKSRAQLQEALAWLRGFVAKYPDTEAAVGALNNIGSCYEGLRDWNEAVAVYDTVIAQYEAREASGEIYLFAREHRKWILETKL